MFVELEVSRNIFIFLSQTNLEQIILKPIEFSLSGRTLSSSKMQTISLLLFGLSFHCMNFNLL